MSGFCGFGGFELWSLRLDSKCFTDWAASPTWLLPFWASLEKHVLPVDLTASFHFPNPPGLLVPTGIGTTASQGHFGFLLQARSLWVFLTPQELWPSPRCHLSKVCSQEKQQKRLCSPKLSLFCESLQMERHTCYSCLLLPTSKSPRPMTAGSDWLPRGLAGHRMAQEQKQEARGPNQEYLYLIHTLVPAHGDWHIQFAAGVSNGC